MGGAREGAGRPRLHDDKAALIVALRDRKCPRCKGTGGGSGVRQLTWDEIAEKTGIPKRTAIRIYARTRSKKKRKLK